MNDLIILKNNLSDIIQLLSSICEKFKVQDSQIIIFPSENSDTPYKEDIKLTVSHHVERLKVARDLLNDTYKIKDFNLKINLYNLKQLLYITKSMTNLVYKNSDFLHAAIGRINELNSKLLRTAIFKENEIIFNTSANNSKQINTQYEFLRLFKKNEQLIKNLSICLSDIFITHDLTKIIKYQEKIEPYIKDENIVFFNSLMENKEEYQSLLFNLIENKQELDEFQTKQINFNMVMEQYHAAKNNLDKRFKEVSDILNKSSTELNTFQTISSFLDGEVNRLKENKDSIDKALNSIDEINKAGEESKNINNYVDNRKEKIEEILKDASDTISILSGSAIGEHLHTQEKKESLAARGWLALSGLLMVISLYFAVIGYNESIFDWNFFTLKILTLPILFSSLFFSMRQYIKRKNIVDSYSYKKTLALSLAGFKKQIDKSTNNEEQIAYVLKTIEILTESPLNSLDKNHIKNDLEALEKMRESVIDNVISTIKNQTTDKKEKKQSTPE